MNIPMTNSGYIKLQSELEHLKSIERPAVVEAIAAARALGDLSENAEYHAAKEKQAIIESRITALENKLNRATVINVLEIKSENIKFGATVEIEDIDTGNTLKFQIVGSDEANIQKGLFPVTSPLSKALIGKKEGDSVDVVTPNGIKTYAILKVQYI